VKATRELFNKHGLRCTKQRLAIYEALRADHSHPTAESLFKCVKPDMGRLSLATVYNTLDALCRAGLVRKLATDNGCCRYEADTRDHLHVRLKNNGRCDDIIDVPDDLGKSLIRSVPSDVLQRIERAMGLSIDGLSIQILARRR
jgi:Fur family transcriptional regulator, peroxide stress response regulator